MAREPSIYAIKTKLRGFQKDLPVAQDFRISQNFHFLNQFFQIYIKILQKCSKNTENGDFDQRLDCVAAKKWLKFTTDIN